MATSSYFHSGSGIPLADDPENFTPRVGALDISIPVYSTLVIWGSNIFAKQEWSPLASEDGEAIINKILTNSEQFVFFKYKYKK